LRGLAAGVVGYERDPVDSPRSSLRSTTPLYFVEKGKKKKEKRKNTAVPLFAQERG